MESNPSDQKGFEFNNPPQISENTKSPESEAGSVVPEKRYQAPQTPTERALGAIWAEVFELEQVDINDSFLELGGDSLTIMRLTSRVRERFELEIPVRQWFENPTIALAAALIDFARGSGTSPQ
jgi:acyl carrier protein